MAVTATSMPGSDIADILRRVETPSAQAQQMPPSEMLQERAALGERARKESGALFALEQQALEERTRRQRAKEERISQEELDLERGVSGQLQQARRVRAEMTLPDPEFKPSQMEMDDYRNLAGMLVGIGMLVGGTGRNGAMYALNSLNGMMKGYAEGRRDLFKNEQIKFDKQLRSIDATNKRIQREFEDAVAMIGTDRAEGLARIKRLSAELNQGVIDADLRLANLAGVRTHLDRLVSASDSAVTILDRRAAEVAAREERREDRREAEAARQAFQTSERQSREAFQREMQREREESRRELAGQKQQEKPLSGSETTKLQGLQSVVSGLQTLIKDFKPQFAGLGVFGFGADAQLEALRRGIRLGLSEDDARQAVRWWSRYNQLQAPNRHALFGATLTGNELTNYRSFTSQPSASAQSVKDNLKDQLNYTQNTFTQRVQNFSDTGYKVPQQVNIPDFWGTYQQATPAQSAAPPSAQQAAPSPAARSTTPRQAVPDRATWIAAAKPLNPSMTEQQLGEAYDNKYGKKL